MADQHPQQNTEPLTVEGCLDSAARLLRAAELETNLALMERLEKLAESWMLLGSHLMQMRREERDG